MTRSGRTLRGLGRPGGGFTLAELMISIGILAVGLVMAASLFPAAMEANRNSIRDVLGSIICENGLAIAKARLLSIVDDPGNKNDPWDRLNAEIPSLRVLADDQLTDLFAMDGRGYPQDDSDTPYGFVLMGRRIDDDQDPETFEGYQLVAVSYRKRSGGKVRAVIRNASAATGGTRVMTYEQVGDMRLGSPVIDAWTGNFATAVEIRSDMVACETDRPLFDYELPAGQSERQIVVVYEEGQSRFSPAMAVMVVRTGLVGEE